MDKRITVVLADANEEFRTALKQALEATGEFDVVGCAADGLAAAQDIAERKPQLLVMDLLLPGLDGFGVLEQAAKDKVQMKTVVVSALYRDQIVSQAMSRGVSFFMPKPCELTSLLDQMRGHGSDPRGRRARAHQGLSVRARGHRHRRAGHGCHQRRDKGALSRGRAPLQHHALAR